MTDLWNANDHPQRKILSSFLSTSPVQQTLAHKDPAKHVLCSRRSTLRIVRPKIREKHSWHLSHHPSSCYFPRALLPGLSTLGTNFTRGIPSCHTVSFLVKVISKSPTDHGPRRQCTVSQGRDYSGLCVFFRVLFQYYLVTADCGAHDDRLQPQDWSRPLITSTDLTFTEVRMCLAVFTSRGEG